MIQNVKIQRGCVETKDSSKRQRACGVYVTERKEIKTTTWIINGAHSLLLGIRGSTKLQNDNG